MTIYLHRFTGTLPAGDVFSFGWHSNSGLSVAASHTNAVGWIEGAWAGGLLTPGLQTIYTAGVVVSKCTTSQLNALTPFNTVAIAETDLTLNGTNVGNSLPQDTAIVCTLRTATPGRKGRGRMFLPAPATDQISATGELLSATIDVINGALSAAWFVSNPAGEQPVIFSRSAGTALPILQFGEGTVFDRQSRRVNKVSTVRTFIVMP
jgi:hypothetical protein